MIQLESLFQGSTFYGAEFDIYDKTTPPRVEVDLTGSLIKMNLVDCYGVAQTFATSDDTLLISGNKITIPKQTITLTPDTYTFDFNITFQNGEHVTGVCLGQWQILDPITK